MESKLVQHIDLPISGMSCASCAGRVERALRNTPGVTNAAVNFATEKASVEFQGTSLSVAALAQVVSDAGYKVPPDTITLQVTGMTCASCAARVEKALLSVDGVKTAQVNAAASLGIVTVVGGAVTPLSLIAAVKAAGYGAEQAQSSQERQVADEKRETRQSQGELLKLLASTALTLPLLAPMVLSPLGFSLHVPALVQLSLAAPLQVIFGARFYVGAFRALRARTANMDTLVALGTTAAFALSLWHFRTGAHLYFESAAAIITFVRFGKYLEGRAKHGTTQAIRSLMSLAPDTARVERDGKEVEVPAESVSRGDVVVVRAGELLPVDGEIVEGESQLDESLLTGESLPVTKHVGDSVIGGSINGNGLLRIRATNVGESSMLARVVALVQSAQGSKAPIQRTVDRVSAVFVPVVLAASVLTVFGNVLFGQPAETAIVAAVSVLVIACPCALGLATPAALTVGTGVAARCGILIKDADSLERAQAIDAVVFDKTGTLTIGRPVVREVLSEDPNRTLALAASVQKGSEHPLGAAIRDAASEHSLVLPVATNFVTLPGRGVEALVEGRTVSIGSPRFRRERGHESSSHDKAATLLEMQGMSVVWVFDVQSVLGALAIGDEPRPTSSEAVAKLQKAGIRVILLTGDNQRAAEAIGTQLKISEVIAEVLPEHKSAHVARLRGEGRKVAMVGDGVNDAPALADADVSFAMGTGSDVAMHSAGITLMRPDPRLVYEAIQISKATTRKIKQNLFWAFLYNAVGIPLAALGMLTPMLAGAAMALSSVSVLANALTLHRWKP